MQISAPNSMSITDKLAKAVDAGEIVRIVYHGGSQPGTIREIAPIAVENNKVSALCLASEIVFFAINSAFFSPIFNLLSSSFKLLI